MKSRELFLCSWDLSLLNSIKKQTDIYMMANCKVPAASLSSSDYPLLFLSFQTSWEQVQKNGIHDLNNMRDR